MNTRILFASVALTASLLAGTAMAASHARDIFIKEQDQNGDGVVTKDEYAATRALQCGIMRPRPERLCVGVGRRAFWP